jgi:hypothetical protein
MSGLSDSPSQVKGAIVTLYPDTLTQRVIALQYNPDSRSRTLQIPATPGGQDGPHVDALRLRRPLVKNEPELMEALRRGVDSVVAIYQKAFRRPPTLSELMHNFLFILGHKPEWYLTGVESLEVEDIASTDGV